MPSCPACNHWTHLPELLSERHCLHHPASMSAHRKAALAKCAAEALLGWPWPCPWTGPANNMQGRLAWQVRTLHGHTMREHQDFPTQLACLDGVRGVLRLAGNDIIHFLQVCNTWNSAIACLQVCVHVAASWASYHCLATTEPRLMVRQHVGTDRALLPMTARRYRGGALGRSTARCSTARGASCTTCTCTALVRPHLESAL